MSDQKPGFLRRIFSFGSKREELRTAEGETVETPAPLPPEPVVPAPEAGAAAAEPTPGPAELAPEAEPHRPTEPAEPTPLPAESIRLAEPSAAVTPPVVAEPEPLRPETIPATGPAPEPGAAAAEPTPEPLALDETPVPATPVSAEAEPASGDFSFLDPDAPLPPETEDPPAGAAEDWLPEPVEPLAEEQKPADDFGWLDPDAPLPPEDEPLAEAEPAPAEYAAEPAEPAPTETAPAAVDVPPLAPAPPQPAARATREERDEFAWLDADAPVPEEDAASDFSFLDAPRPAERAPRVSTGEAGWRLRDAADEAPPPLAPAPRVTFAQRLRTGLARSSGQLSASITSLFTKRRLDEATLQEFEDVLIQADLGVETAMRITDRLSDGRFGKEISGAEVRSILADEVEATLRPVALPLELDLEKKPHVILVVGVNGTGKTTTIGKLAAKLTSAGLKVTLCAGDTFRAAAIEQLRIWGERTSSPVIAKAIGADAAGLAFEAYDEAVANGSDVLVIDTAGRLQNRAELMDELAKIVRVLQKRDPDAPHTVLQTLDATTGQNALSQVEIFRNVAGVNGLVMTKLDGTARGGILVAIAAKYRLPVYFVGVGEGIDDLEPFRARDFAQAIAGEAAASA